jgi:uncharacterized glyoxalase superfamily protein PhnB
MIFKELRPMLWTKKLDETINFYEQTLDFTCDERNDEWGWASMHRDKVEIMFAKPNAHTPFDKPNFTGSFYINVDNVDDLWEKLKDLVQVAYPIDNFEYEMREFAIYDSNGYILQFGQPINNNV